MKKILIVLLTLAFSTAMFAQKVSEEQALQKAQQFFKDKGIVSANPRRAKKIEQQSDATQEDFYVFNAENKGGFVIISGDERTPEVLGYADSGSLDMDTLPPNIKWWLSEYTKQIKAIDSLGITKRSVSKRAPKAAIATLMTTKWGQDYPYNMNCPDFFDTGYKCVTGCVATAMAQVMYYHRTKSTNMITNKIPGYTGDTYWQGLGQLTIDEIPKESIIDWDNMLDIYNGSETTTQKEAVANLMLYCGASIKMDYGVPSAFSGGSGAYSFDVPIALKQYFDYSENTTLLYRDYYTEEEWDELIYSELNKGNPIYYSGSNESAGHAFVCDGYDGNGYYHINWGWDGLSDSFFLLSALNPNQQSTGGSSAGYNDGQCALIGTVPNGEIMRLTSQSVSLTGNTSFAINGNNESITVPVRWNVKNQVGTSCTFDHAIGLYHKGELVKVLKETGTSEMFTANQEKTIDASLVIETYLSSGTYQLYALSRSQDEEKWFRNETSSDCYITLVIKDGSMSFYVGKPAAAENIINFADDEVKRICVENWDTDGDGEISLEEAAAVTDFGYVFDRSIIKTFDEAKYFTGITSFGLTSVGGFGCKSLTSITLPSSVVSIKDGAFFACFALSSIEIPASVKEIGKNAFQACFSLQELILNEGLERINNEAFYKCSSLNSVSFPSTVSSIGDNMWFECSNLNNFYVDGNNPNYRAVDGVLFSKDEKTLIYFPTGREGTYQIPTGTETINSYGFNFSKLDKIVFPESVTTIGDYALGQMINLKEFTIPSTVTNLGIGVFEFCSNLKSVVLPDNLSEIPVEMFAQCWSLKIVDLPNNLTSIRAYAFFNCDKLIEISIPGSVISIGDYAFANSGLRKVTSHIDIPCTITSSVFNNINSNAILYVPEESLNAYKAADNWKNFSQILPIGEKGFEPYVEFYNGVLSFHYDTKKDERDGTTYEITENYSWLENSNDITKVIFDASFINVRPNTTLEWFNGCDKLTEVQGLENLNTSEVTNMRTMFQNCRSLTNIDLSHFNTSKVTSMSAMFWGCSNLKTIILPDDLTFIDSWQFVYCSSLKEITIPADVTSIGDNAFSASGLKKVTCLMQIPCTITSTVFERINSNAILYVPEESITAYKEADYWKDFPHIFPIDKNGREPYVEFYNGVLSFHYDTNREERDGKTYEITENYSWLENRNEITTVIFDTSFENVRPNTTCAWFDECNKLTAIQGIENLNTSEVTTMFLMFQNCYSLETLDLSNFNTGKVTSMSGMFFGCRNLETVILPDDLTFIDSGQFQYCSSLTDISIPASVTSIGDRAFYYCTSLEEITIPAQVTSIGDNAFTYSGITKVKSLMQTPCEISSTVFENVSNNATLYVPAGCKAAYEAADYWKDFKKIMGPSSNLIYMVDGEEYRSYEIEHGSAITPEPAPTKETYVFSGWSEIPETMPDHDVIVTGTFERHFDVGHVVNVVNFIMNANATPEDIALYDLNNDNELNIGDIILIVKNILNQSNSGANSVSRRASTMCDFAQYTAAQFELKLDKNASIKNIHLVGSMTQSHQLMYEQKDNNTYAVVVYSLSNQLMKPENGRIVDVEADGGELTMQNITVATQSGETHYYQSYGTPTGIYQLENDSKSAVIYDLKGNRLNGKALEKGIYIINGKKVIVK